jgi:hypothetical protein
MVCAATDCAEFTEPYQKPSGNACEGLATHDFCRLARSVVQVLLSPPPPPQAASMGSVSNMSFESSFMSLLLGFSEGHKLASSKAHRQ